MAKKVLVSSEASAAEMRASGDAAEIIRRVRTETRIRLEADPEWTLPRATPIQVILRAFAHGVLAHDEWHVGYRVPFGLEELMNELAGFLEQLAGVSGSLNVSLLDIERMLATVLATNVTWRGWGGDPSEIIIVTPESRMGWLPQRVAIDPDAALLEIGIAIRNHRRGEDYKRQAAKHASRT